MNENAKPFWRQVIEITILVVIVSMQDPEVVRNMKHAAAWTRDRLRARLEPVALPPAHDVDIAKLMTEVRKITGEM